MKKITIISLGILSFILVLGCKPKDNTSSSKPSTSWMIESEDGILPGVNPLDVSGNIVTAGSSTVFPLSEALAQRFKEEGYDGEITVDSIGTGAGFERFTVTGETDISNASRPIKAKEKEDAKAIGRNPLEFRVGTDALAVTIAHSNTFVKDVTLEELALLFTSEKWSDVRPEWPEKAILKFIPGTDSGTFDYFVEAVFNEDPTALLGSNNLQLSEDDNILVQGISESPYGIGFFGYAYYLENAPILNILTINGVEANQENLDLETYPLARPLFIYSDAGVMQKKPQIAAFINFYLTYASEEVLDVGYFPTTPKTLEQAKNLWLTTMQMNLAN